MRILVFGASGGTGRQLVSQGLEQGHTITAFVRNPAALATFDVALIIKNPKLFIDQGNVLNAKDAANSVKNQDVVISVLGNKTTQALWQKDTTISEGVKKIIAGMKQHHVKRLLFVASFGVNEEIFFPEKLFIRTFLKNIFVDIPTQENLIKQSGLDWTLVHPARLTNGLKTEKYKEGEHLPIGLFSQISRADVADFLLKQINSKKYLRKKVTISY